jgi:SsrA-binding protein
MAHKAQDYRKIITTNRRAKYDYFIDQELQAGIVLTGTEVKSLRNSTVSLNESYVEEFSGEMYLINCYIPEYVMANRYNHDPVRKRKLLLCKREIKKLTGLLRIKGVTIVPLVLYFNNRNLVKVDIAVVRGKKLYDKRESIKEKDWNRQKARVMKEGALI